MDGWMDGPVDERMEGWMERCTEFVVAYGNVRMLQSSQAQQAFRGARMEFEERGTIANESSVAYRQSCPGTSWFVD